MTAQWFFTGCPGDGDDLARLEAACAWLDDALAKGAFTGVPGASRDTAAILAALSDPVGLPGASLPAYGVPGDGCCRDCLRPPVYSQGLCVYCAELARGETGTCKHGLEKALCRAAPDCGDPGLARVAVLLLLLAAALIAVLWAAGVIT